MFSEHSKRIVFLNLSFKNVCFLIYTNIPKNIKGTFHFVNNLGAYYLNVFRTFWN